MAQTTAYAEIPEELKQAKLLLADIIDNGNRNPRTQKVTYQVLIRMGLIYMRDHSEYSGVVKTYVDLSAEEEKKILESIDT